MNLKESKPCSSDKKSPDLTRDQIISLLEAGESVRKAFEKAQPSLRKIDPEVYDIVFDNSVLALNKSS